jgi:hypothetical protein
MFRVLKPPTPLKLPEHERSVFLAGSIELGQAENWQVVAERDLANHSVVVLNPRRDEWDASWVQSISNPAFREQVEWELDAQDRADLIAMYFSPETKAPITLLELGLFATSGKVIVGCPPGYWRRGNVEVVCARYSIPLVGSLAELLALVRSRLATFG